MKILTLLMGMLPFLSASALAGRTLSYKHDDAALEGYVAFPAAKGKGPRPVVLIVHDWMGEGKFSREKADKIAKLGFVGFSVDIYGKGVRPKDAKEAGELSTKFKNDRALLRGRIRAAYDAALKLPQVKGDKVAVMGFCFGGTTALELARSGADLAGTISFHGGLATPSPASPGSIRGKVLVLHGANDPLVPAQEVSAFMDEMRAAKADWQFIAYGGAVHSFTNPAAKGDATAYHPEADRLSWRELKNFLSDTLH